MTEQLPNALDMLKLDPDGFWLEVRKVYCEKPWEHYFLYRHDGTFWCSRCHTVHTIVELYPDGKHMSQEAVEPCTVPPPITDPPEVVAMRLRDEPQKRGHTDMPEAISAVNRALGGKCGCDFCLLYHWGFTFTPQQQIACCLVALGLWQIKETP